MMKMMNEYLYQILMFLMCTTTKIALYIDNDSCVQNQVGTLFISLLYFRDHYLS